MRKPSLSFIAASLSSLLLAACGGGAGDGGIAVTPDVVAASAGTNVTDRAVLADPATATPGASDRIAGAMNADTPARMAAAVATAGDSSNACGAIRPFYWEIGDRDGRAVGGSVGKSATGASIRATTSMPYASATKWLYAAYVAQRRDGRLEPWDVRMLSMRAGYVDFAGCRASQTVDGCAAWLNNDRFSASAEGAFHYGGGHMQRHASLFGLGSLDAAGLAAEMRTQLGEDVAIGMAHAQPGGGANGTPAAYATFLRKLLGESLVLGSLLGVDPACASVEGCAAGEALYSPAPASETWHYSLGHWVEDDPVHGDGAFSSAGAFGFYPWIDASRTQYGIVARSVRNDADADGIGAGEASARCGRLIRRAWATGVAQ